MNIHPYGVQKVLSDIELGKFFLGTDYNNSFFGLRAFLLGENNTRYEMYVRLTGHDYNGTENDLLLAWPSVRHVNIQSPMAATDLNDLVVLKPKLLLNNTYKAEHTFEDDRIGGLIISEKAIHLAVFDMMGVGRRKQILYVNLATGEITGRIIVSPSTIVCYSWALIRVDGNKEEILYEVSESQLRRPRT